MVVSKIWDFLCQDTILVYLYSHQVKWKDGDILGMGGGGGGGRQYGNKGANGF